MYSWFVRFWVWLLALFIKPCRSLAPFHPDTPILGFGDNVIRLSELYESCMVTGAAGAGKTSSVGAHLSFNLLAAGCAMVVFCVKADEYARIKAMCDELGRDCIRFGIGEKWRLDVLDYSLSHAHASVDEVVALLETLIEIANRSKGDRNDDVFWQLLAKRIMRCCLIGTWYGNGRCSVRDLFAFVASLPQSPAELESEPWVTGSFAGRCMTQAFAKDLSPEKVRDLELASDFMDEWVVLSEKTRSIGHTIVQNILAELQSGAVGELCSSGETNLTPEMIFRQGLCVVIDVPILLYREPAQYLQVIMKSIIQRAALRRDVAKDPIPLVLWMDEANWLVAGKHDSLALSVGRASRLIHCALFQNLPLLYRSFGSGEGARDDAMGWIGNFATRIACANSCTVTNEWWQSLCGHSRHLFFSGSSQMGDYSLWDDLTGKGVKFTGSFAEQWHQDFPAAKFARLRKGSAGNDFIVDVVVYQNGRIWTNGKTFLPASFKQRIGNA